jgi:hypothetical protein
MVLLPDWLGLAEYVNGIFSPTLELRAERERQQLEGLSSRCILPNSRNLGGDSRTPDIVVGC